VMCGRRSLWAAVGLLLLSAPVPAVAQMAVLTAAVTTDGSGDATDYTGDTAGLLRAIRYVPDETTPLDGGADITITDTATGLELLTVTNLGTSAREFHPRVFTVNSVGAVALYAAGGVSVLTELPVAGTIQVVTASGGNARSGTFYIFVQGR